MSKLIPITIRQKPAFQPPPAIQPTVESTDVEHLRTKLVQELDAQLHLARALSRTNHPALRAALHDSLIELQQSTIGALERLQPKAADPSAVSITPGALKAVFDFAGAVISTSRSPDLEKRALRIRDAFRPELQKRGLAS